MQNLFVYLYKTCEIMTILCSYLKFGWPSLEVIKLEYSLKHKIKYINDWALADTCP